MFESDHERADERGEQIELAIQLAVLIRRGRPFFAAARAGVVWREIALHLDHLKDEILDWVRLGGVWGGVCAGWGRSAAVATQGRNLGLRRSV